MYRWFAAVAASALLLFAGTGLTPWPWATWLAPLPVLLLARTVGPRPAAGAAFLAWLLSTTNESTYLVRRLEVPVPIVLGYGLGTAAVFAAVVLLFRALRPHHPILATLAPAAGWASAEWLVSLVSPHGAFWSLAYTQYDLAPVRELAAATGPWGISFLVLAVPAGLAAAGRRRPGPVLVAGALVIVMLAFGWPRPADGPTVRIGLIALPQPEAPVPLSTPEGQALLTGYLTQLSTVASQGAAVAVLPEKVFAVSRPELAGFTGTFTAAATRDHLTIVVGVALSDGGTVRNLALAFDGPAVVSYTKHHLIPGIEDGFEPGRELAAIHGYGLTVCKDLDFPDLSLGNGAAGLVLAPAWDFQADGWSHSRMGLLRGIEGGYAVARPARNGRLTLADAHGRLYLDVPVPSGHGATAVADVPVGARTTPYERLGDWFSYLAVTLLLAGIGYSVRSGPHFRSFCCLTRRRQPRNP